MTNAKDVARFHINHEKDFSIKGNRPVYTCERCGKTKEHEIGDLETATCACGGTMQVHFTKDL